MKAYGMTTDLRIEVLEKLAQGWSLEETYPETARRRGIDFRIMREVAEGYGHPDRAAMSAALARLRATYAAEHPPEPKKAAQVQGASKGHRTGTYAVPTAVPERLAPPPPPAVAPPPQGAPVPEPQPAPVTASLIERARRSPNLKTRRAGEKAKAALDVLREFLEKDRVEAEARAEIERLEAELAAQRARLGLSPKVKPYVTPSSGRPVDYETRVVRAWADENGWACPRAGRYLPKALVDAWREATQPTEAQEAQQ